MPYYLLCFLFHTMPTTDMPYYAYLYATLCLLQYTMPYYLLCFLFHTMPATDMPYYAYLFHRLISEYAYYSILCLFQYTMPTTDMPYYAYYSILCLLFHTMSTIPYYAILSILYLLCHIMPIICLLYHTMPTMHTMPNCLFRTTALILPFYFSWCNNLCNLNNTVPYLELTLCKF